MHRNFKLRPFSCITEILPICRGNSYAGHINLDHIKIMLFIFLSAYRAVCVSAFGDESLSHGVTVDPGSCQAARGCEL